MIYIHNTRLMTKSFTRPVCRFLLALGLIAASWHEAEAQQIVILPLGLIQFSVAPDGDAAALRWEMSAKEIYRKFYIERSVDARNWIALDSIAVEPPRTLFAYTDASPDAGRNFYRLRINDGDSSHEFSQVVQIRFKSDPLSVCPNPLQSQLVIGPLPAGRLLMRISDALGRVVMQRELMEASAGGMLSLSREALGIRLQGMYRINVRSEDGIDMSQTITAE